MSHRLSGVPVNLLVAIFILFSILIFTFTLVFVTVVVPGYRLTTSFKVAYNIINTVLATVLARYASGEIQKQWLRQINHDISDVKYQLQHDPDVLVRWRAVMGINTFYERIVSFRSTVLPQLSFLFTGLITAAVVAAVTLTDTTCYAEINPPRIHSGADNRCTRVVPNNQTERSSPLWEYRTFWNNDDGSAYYATTNLGCPSWSGAQFIGSINTVNPNHVAYARSGVGVQRSAIGTPEIFYTDFPNLIEPSERPFGHYIDQSNLRTVSQCLPVMATNPVQCRPGGKVSFESNIPQNLPDDEAVYHRISVDAGGCNFTQANAEDPNGAFGVMVSRFCPADNQVGKGTVAMGATGIISLTLAASIGDLDFLAKHASSYDAMKEGGGSNGLSYAISCDVDVKPTIKWRNLTLELRQGNLTSTPSYSKLVSGVDGCDAKTNNASWALGNGYAGGAAAALVPLLSEGRYWNGMTNTIFQQAINVTDTSEEYSTVESWQQLVRKKEVAGFGFEDSANALEDVLGLTAGITMSQMSTWDSMRESSPLKDSVDFRPGTMGKATFACTRVGSGNRSALLFTLPSLLSMLVAIYLIFSVPREPTTYKTSRLDDLVAIGMASERELSFAYRQDHQRPDGQLNGLTPIPTRSSSYDEVLGVEKAMGLQELRAVHRKEWD